MGSVLVVPAVEPAVFLPERYEVQHRVASGGMATVWAARDTMLHRRVAVKVLSDALAGDESARARFLREARAGARLSDHPHVVTVYDLGEHADRAYMVMELMTAGTLGSRLASGRRPPRHLAMRWVAQTAAALDAAHALDIVHRDVKPANLLLDERNRLAVGDFGIASVAGEASMTQTGLVLGTAAYLAPEQARGEAATPASDRYALACIAFELLTGRRPFVAQGAAAQARAHVEDAPPAASGIVSDLPGAADAVLRRGLAKDPADRPDSAGAFAESLAAALDEDVTAVTRALRPAAIAPPVAASNVDQQTAPMEPTPEPEPVAHARTPRPAASGASTPPPPPPPARRGSSRRPAVAALLGATALVAVALVALLGGGDDPQRAASPAGTTPAKAAEPPPETTAAPEKTTPAEPPSTPAPASGEDPRALSDRAYGLMQGGDPAAAVPLARRAVEGFRAQGRTDELAYAFALYNLGASLNRSGNPAEAIPYLEERLKISDNQRDVVKRELKDAREKLKGDGGGGKPGKPDKGDKDDD